MLLAGGAMVPILAFAVLVSVILLEQDRETVQRAALDRARAMMTGVDAELRGSVATIQALGTSDALDDGDLPRFHAQAARMLATQPMWTNVTLLRPSGEKLVDASRPHGEPLRATIDVASVARAVATMEPAIGNVDSSPALGAGVPIRVPVMRDGKVVYVVTAIVRPKAFEDLLRQQRLPEGWISGIVDSNGRFVARLPPRPAGDLASAAFRAAVLQSPEGWSRGLTIEGRDVFSAHEVSQFSRWSIGLAIPADIVLGGARRTALMIGLGVLASMAVAMAIVAATGRRIARPIVALAAVARSIGSGKASPLPAGGDVDEVTDVAAALQEADAAVRERQSLIQREKDALQAADTAKDEFIAALSHELRNPLAAMTAASHFLRMADPTHAAASDARGVIDRQTKHMSRMIEDLLDVSRIIMGKATLLRETFDLAPIATNLVDAWRAQGRFGARIVSVNTRPAWITADRTRIEQILSNLLDNAVKFTPPATRITVTVARDGDAAELSVADDGPGIPPNLVPRVFDVFVQEEQGVGRSRGGMGVGLTLVKRLAELQGGSVSVTNAEPGSGARFTLRFPAVSKPMPVAEPAPSDSRHVTPCRIVVVEDNADARDMLRQVLQMSGHEVLDAGDGATGVALALERGPDVAIVDIGLPDIDGYEVARAIRARADRRVALIALTGYGQPEDRRRALDAGFDVHLVKPVAIDQLEEAIARAVRRKASASTRVGD